MKHDIASVPRVAAVNDISGYGRCSLTVTIPILSAMGVQCCPLPTAVLSQHTGFEQFYFNDLTPHIAPYIESWRSLGIHFDAVYTGFLGSDEQIGLVDSFLRDQSEDTLILVDPVMGDDGQRYVTYTPKMCDGMRQLVGCADIITPNITEACLLAGTGYRGESPDSEFIRELAEQLTALGPKVCVITGIRDGSRIASLAYDRKEKRHFTCTSEYVNAPFMGTGDIFASVLCGAFVKGNRLKSALQCACDFLCDAVRYTSELGSPAMEGIAFEPLLYRLGGKINERK